MSAVSKRVMPASSAALTVWFTAASSILLRNWLHPRPTTETRSPLLPSCLCCMATACPLRHRSRRGSAQVLGDALQVAEHAVAGEADVAGDHRLGDAAVGEADRLGLALWLLGVAGVALAGEPAQAAHEQLHGVVAGQRGDGGVEVLGVDHGVAGARLLLAAQDLAQLGDAGLTELVGGAL